VFAFALSLMSRLVVLAVPFLAAFLTTLLMVPPVMRLAISKHWLDEPDGLRRSHTRPVPRLGGVGIFAGVVLAFGVAPLIGLFSGATPAVPHLTSAGALILASAILFLIGLCDDLRGVPPLAKLAGQTLAAIVVVYAGFRIDHLVFPPAYELSLGWLSIPITIVWLVGVSNALNLVDGLDGLAGGVSVIALLTATVAAVAVGNTSIPWYTLALGGALLGFLRYNFAPAKIFLGDSGSLVVGFLLAVLTVKGATRPDQATYALAPIFALSFPLLDTGIAMMRRWLRGTPLSRADARHIHHQLRGLGLSPHKAVIVIYVESAVVAVLGLCVTFAPPEFTVAVAAAGAAILLFIMVYGVRWLEYHEFLEAGASVTSAARQARWVIQDKINARDLVSAIRNADTFEKLTVIIEEAAPTFRFSHMELRNGALARHLPPHIAGELHTARFCKLEYPIAQRVAKSNDFVTLNIWCTTETLKRPVGAERVARIIGPAISNWLEISRLPVPTTSTPAVAAVTATVATTTAAAVALPNTPPSPQPERERPRRPARPAHMSDGDRIAGIAMVAKHNSRGDEMRS
jgi:UDP-GlcNAc:undecaprenyl-phosphate GlcNAc-1-phosphate transferase